MLTHSVLSNLDLQRVPQTPLAMLAAVLEVLVQHKPRLKRCRSRWRSRPKPEAVQILMLEAKAVQISLLEAPVVQMSMLLEAEAV